MSDIRLYMLQTGTIKCKVHNIKMNQGNGADYEIPIPFFLLTHPNGHTLIDGGNAVETATDPEGYWGTITKTYWPVMREDEGCIAQVKKLDIDPADIRYVVQSHLHLDHTGAIGRFPNATHIVQRREYEYAYTPDWFAAGGYIRKDFDRSGLKWEFLDGERNDMFDVYGDGTLKTVFTPGHSPGHQSLLVTLPNSGSLLLTIDAAYTLDHWEERALPGFLTSTIETVRSVQKLRHLAKRTNAIVVTGHDPDAWPTFRQAPEYYD
ncbi:MULTISPECIES: AttM family quorum-quenching N-acyl homoserine lactonase [Photorhabdus]|nr:MULTISPECIES: N-acyl homoserine lactonase family protein [Photorhabdus]MCC8385709.1 N-acyl homoserine lactonase family protein [Photorhabdus laumondii]MCC8389452.1 N-acyl homoserine lactonase family protein [Photorhabdus laumondii]MCC8414595.1 N-acyl homoserine lactonase family protein [Photorhabdus laumondii]